MAAALAMHSMDDELNQALELLKGCPDKLRKGMLLGASLYLDALQRAYEESLSRGSELAMRHVYFQVAGGSVVMASDFDAMKLRAETAEAALKSVRENTIREASASVHDAYSESLGTGEETPQELAFNDGVGLASKLVRALLYAPRSGDKSLIPSLEETQEAVLSEHPDAESHYFSASHDYEVYAGPWETALLLGSSTDIPQEILTNKAMEEDFRSSEEAAWLAAYVNLLGKPTVTK
jgi:hypothetical protein